MIESALLLLHERLMASGLREPFSVVLHFPRSAPKINIIIECPVEEPAGHRRMCASASVAIPELESVKNPGAMEAALLKRMGAKLIVSGS